MSNNDLFCSKCQSHHHPVECPLDVAPTVQPSDEETAQSIEDKCSQSGAFDLADVYDAKKMIVEALTNLRREKDEEIRNLEETLVQFEEIAEEQCERMAKEIAALKAERQTAWDSNFALNQDIIVKDATIQGLRMALDGIVKYISNRTNPN